MRAKHKLFGARASRLLRPTCFWILTASLSAIGGSFFSPLRGQEAEKPKQPVDTAASSTGESSTGESSTGESGSGESGSGESGTRSISAPVVGRLDANSIASQIDAFIDKQLEEASLPVAETSSDVEFLRRVAIEIAGTVPNAEQAARFLENSDEQKRSLWVDELLASDDFGKHFGRVWRDWIAPAELPSEGNGGNQPITATRNLGKWFAEQFNAGKPWDDIVRSIMEVDGNLKENPQSLFFSLTGTDTGYPEPAGAARAVSSLFLGLDLQCAQCHDDPYREWKQTDFWGTAAFFRNTKGKFNGRYFDSISETLGKKKSKTPNGSISIPRDSFENAGTVVAARYVWGDGIEAKSERLRPLLSDWIVSPENPYFARAFVNRTWSYFFARGLVEPVDDMRPGNKPSHPEVLDLLTQEFLKSEFDVKHLIRCIVNSRAYQRSHLDPSKDPESKVLNAFGRRPVKLMSADQLYDSLRLALEDPRLDVRTYNANESKKFGESSPVGDEYTEFQRLFETDENNATVFTHGIPQFLALLNHERVSSGGPAVARLVKEKVEPDRAVAQLYLSTLSREPSEDEAKEAAEFVSASPDRKSAYAGVLWMLLNRSEFLLVR